MYNKNIATLDINAFIEQTMQVTLPDGDVIDVRKPTKKIAVLFGEIEKAEDDETKSIILKTIIREGFSNNLQKKEVDISDWPDSMLAGAFTGYVNFLNAVMAKNP